MSFSRLDWDECAYKFKLMQSVDAAGYGLQTPRAECVACFPADPVQRATGAAATRCADKPLVDVESELRTLHRRASSCPTAQYLPSPTGEYCAPTVALADCQAVPNETTRLSNPPCTLRGTGWNRWEWLCQDPQAKALLPFGANVASRTVAKDNHRPCVEQPINQSPALPPLNASDEVYKGPEPCQSGTQPTFTSLHWRDARTYAAYLRGQQH